MPDNFPIQQISRVVFKLKLKRLPYKTTYLSVEWGSYLASTDSSLSKDLYGFGWPLGAHCVACVCAFWWYAFLVLCGTVCVCVLGVSVSVIAV